MNVIMKKVSDLIPYERNTKKHDKIQIANVAESIKQYGFVQPVVIDKDDVIVIGHCRVLGAKKLKMKEVPCVCVDDLTPEQVNALRIVDNKTNESDWDFDLLAEELPEIDLSMFDFDFGLDDEEEETEVIEDEAPEVDETKEPTAKLGDIWQLGRHRLMCGDSTDPEMVAQLMDGEKADMLLTDPPYNMSDNLSGFISDKMKSKLDNIVDFEPDTIVDTIESLNLKNIFIFTSKDLIPKYFEIFKSYGFNILVWCKDNPTPMTNNTFLPDIEYLLYFYKKGRCWNNKLDVSVYKKYYNSNKMEGAKEAGGKFHPTIKPQQILQDKIKICSNNGRIVVDLFGGSGSTLIACEQTDRRCFTMEYEPHYVDVIIKRWEDFTGEKAVLLNG